MKKNMIPAIGIVIVTLILLALNQFTELTFIKDYSLIFIISGMLLGVGLTKLANHSKDKNLN